MQFGAEKHAIAIELPDGKVIKSLQEGESYRYLRILETYF